MGTVYIHNRVHLNKTHEAPPPPGMPLAEPPTSDQPPSRNVESKSPLIAHNRRPSRSANGTAKYKQFVLSK